MHLRLKGIRFLTLRHDFLSLNEGRYLYAPSLCKRRPKSAAVPVEK